MSLWESLARSWPSGVESHVQDGSRIRALVVYLTQHHMLAFKRCSSHLGDLFEASISTAAVLQACVQAANVLTPVVAEIGDALSQAPIAYTDETGFRLEKRLHWLHTVCTSTLTYIHCDRMRRSKTAVFCRSFEAFFIMIVGSHIGFSTANMHYAMHTRGATPKRGTTLTISEVEFDTYCKAQERSVSAGRFTQSNF